MGQKLVVGIMMLRFKKLPSQDTSGFTLVELMVAVLLFGIVITTIFASYRTVFSSADRVNSGLDRYDMAGICLNRMSLDLLATHVALPPQYRKPEFDDPPDPYRIVGVASDPEIGEFPLLRFASLAHVPLHGTDFGGIARIVYYVRGGTEEASYRLHRADTLMPTEPFEGKDSDPVVCAQVKSLKITYYDHEGNAHESWDSESDEFNFASPTSIEILIQIGQNEDTISFTTTVKLPVQRAALE